MNISRLAESAPTGLDEFHFHGLLLRQNPMEFCKEHKCSSRGCKPAVERFLTYLLGQLEQIPLADHRCFVRRFLSHYRQMGLNT